MARRLLTRAGGGPILPAVVPGTGTPPLSPPEPQRDGQRRRPETPAERHARRKAWGAHYGPTMRALIAPQIAAYDAQQRGR